MGIKIIRHYNSDKINNRYMRAMAARNKKGQLFCAVVMPQAILCHLLNQEHEVYALNPRGVLSSATQSGHRVLSNMHIR